MALAVALLAVGCSESDDAPHVTSPPSAAVGATSTGQLSVSVLRSDGTPAAGAVVTVVHPTAGPIAWAAAASDGTALFSDLDQDSYCVHARADVSFEAGALDLFPAASPGAGLAANRTGDAAVISGKGRDKSPPLTYGTYTGCLADPPVTVRRNTTSIELVLAPGARLDVALLDLNGEMLSGNMHAGIVTPFGSCDDFPWMAATVCSDEDKILPGFLHSVNTVASPARLSVPQNAEYVIEALQNVPQQGLLTFTRKNNPFATGDELDPVALQLEPVLCEVNKQPEAVGDGGSVDIGAGNGGLSGYVKYGIQADYPSLTPDPSQVAVWWEQTGSDRMTFDSRTRYANGTYTSSITFDVQIDGGAVQCTTVSVSAQPGANPSSLSVYCALAEDGRVRVTVRQTDIETPWAAHEFSIRGGGDAVPDASRADATRAFVEVPSHDTCSVQATNDDRWAVLL